MFPKQTPNLKQNLALDVLHTVMRIGNPEPQLQFDGVVSECHNQRVRGWMLQGACGTASGLFHQGQHLLDVCIERRTLLCDQFSTCCVMICSLGIRYSVPSRVSTAV